MPWHICHVTTVHPWSDARIFERMCVGLAGVGHEVTLVAPIERERTERGVRVLPTGLTGKVQRLLGMPGLLRRLAALEADVYHFHDPELLLWMAAFRRTGRCVVYDVHEYYPEAVVDSNYFGWRPLSRLVGSAFAVLEPWLARQCDAIVAVTPPIGARLAGGTTVGCTVPNVTPLAALDGIRPDPPATAQTLVMAGVLDDSRAMTPLVSAMALLAPRWPEIRLECYGDLRHHPFGAVLRAHAERLGVGDRLVYHPRIPWVQAQAALASSAAGLVLYDDRRNNRWGLPNRLFDYMAHGVPVIATDFPLLREIVEEAGAGFLVDSRRPEAIADALDAVFRDPAGAGAMGAQGRAAVRRRWNWEHAQSTLEGLYEELLRRPRPRRSTNAP